MNKRLEEILAEDPALREIYARRPAATRKPKRETAVVAVVSQKFAEAAKANPANVRLSVPAVDDTVVVERPRRSEIVEVLEVDGQGRVALARNLDPQTGAMQIVEFEGGYRRSGVVSNYDPIKRFGEGLGE
jgi:hypothetical protein